VLGEIRESEEIITLDELHPGGGRRRRYDASNIGRCWREVSGMIGATTPTSLQAHREGRALSDDSSLSSWSHLGRGHDHDLRGLVNARSPSRVR
jgi:hypothetical protein